MTIRWQQPRWLGRVLQKAIYALNQCPICGMVSSIARIHRSRNQGVEKDPLEKFLLPIPMILSSGLHDLVPEGGSAPTRRHKSSTELEAQTSP